MQPDLATEHARLVAKFKALHDALFKPKEPTKEK